MGVADQIVASRFSSIDLSNKAPIRSQPSDLVPSNYATKPPKYVGTLIVSTHIICPP